MLRHSFNRASLGLRFKFSVPKKFLNSTCLLIKIHMPERSEAENFGKMVFLIIKDCIFGDIWVIYTICWSLIFYKNSIFVGHPNKTMAGNSREAWEMCATDSILFSFYVTKKHRYALLANPPRVLLHNYIWAQY